MLNKFLIYRIHCIVLSDYAGGISLRWSYSKKLGPEWGVIPPDMGASPYQCSYKDSSIQFQCIYKRYFKTYKACEYFQVAANPCSSAKL
jgi:hypothetical protein